MKRDVDPVEPEPLEALLDRAPDAVGAVVEDDAARLGRRRRTRPRGRRAPGGRCRRRPGCRPSRPDQAADLRRQDEGVARLRRRAPRPSVAPRPRSRTAAPCRSSAPRATRRARTVSMALASSTALNRPPIEAPPKPRRLTSRPVRPSGTRSAWSIVIRLPVCRVIGRGSGARGRRRSGDPLTSLPSVAYRPILGPMTRMLNEPAVVVRPAPQDPSTPRPQGGDMTTAAGRSAERFLVTGALGCIGAWTVRPLVREGVPVVAFDLGTDRPPARPDHVARGAGRGSRSSPATSPTWLGRARPRRRTRITNVIHLAALQVPFCRADPPRGALVNVVGTVNVFEAVRRRADRMAPVVYTELDRRCSRRATSTPRPAGSRRTPTPIRATTTASTSSPTRAPPGSTGRRRASRASASGR